MLDQIDLILISIVFTILTSLRLFLRFKNSIFAENSKSMSRDQIFIQNLIQGVRGLLEILHLANLLVPWALIFQVKRN